MSFIIRFVIDYEFGWLIIVWNKSEFQGQLAKTEKQKDREKSLKFEEQQSQRMQINKIFEFVEKLNQNDEYTKLTQSGKQAFDQQFQQLLLEQKQTWVQFAINEIFSIIIQGHLHKAQTYFVFLIQTLQFFKIDPKPYHQELQELMQKCFLDDKKLKKKEFENYQLLFQQLGMTNNVKQKRRNPQPKQGFFAKFCACLRW